MIDDLTNHPPKKIMRKLMSELFHDLAVKAKTTEEAQDAGYITPAAAKARYEEIFDELEAWQDEAATAAATA